MTIHRQILISAWCASLTLAIAGEAWGQDNPMSLSSEKETSTATLALAGFAGAGLGLVGGGLLGRAIERGILPVRGDDPGLAGSIVGAGIGSALLAPVAVRAANDGEGSLGAAMLTSVGVTGANYAVLYAFSRILPESVVPYVMVPGLFIVMPASQVGVSIAILRATD